MLSKLTIGTFRLLPDALTQAIGIVGRAVENTLEQGSLTSFSAYLVKIKNSEKKPRYQRF